MTRSFLQGQIGKRELMTTVTKPIARVGDTFPEIKLPRLNGGTIDFSDPRGKRLLLFFWGSW